MLVQSVVVTGDRLAAADELSRRVAGLTPEAALESPFLLLGTAEQIAEDLVARAEPGSGSPTSWCSVPRWKRSPRSWRGSEAGSSRPGYSSGALRFLRWRSM